MLEPRRKNAISKMIRSGQLEPLKTELTDDILHYTTTHGSWLHIAARHGQYQVASWLIDRGINVNADTGGQGAMALAIAARKGHADIVKLLLDAGAELDTSTSVRDPLWGAILGGNIEVGKLLVDHGIDVNASHNGGTTALDFAKHEGATEFVELLTPLTKPKQPAADPEPESDDSHSLVGESSPMTVHEGDDSAILSASQRARDTFRDFFKLRASDFNRVLPALQTAVVKAMFSDSEDSAVEHMWVDDIRFDGVAVQGILQGEPNWLRSVKGGDRVSISLDKISDWLIVMGEKVYGGFTIQAIRAGMSDAARRQHDEAWGLSFPSPDTVLIPDESVDAAEVIASVIAEQVEKDPSKLNLKMDGGRTILHLEALYGRAPCVKVLLDRGASKDAVCDRGWTALDYANSLLWKEVIELLQ